LSVVPFLGRPICLRIVERRACRGLSFGKPLFDYDPKQPLDVQDTVIAQFSGGTLHDITYASPRGGRVGAYLVVPEGRGPFAAILFGHWGNGTRAEFIPEAKISAQRALAELEGIWNTGVIANSRMLWRGVSCHQYGSESIDRLQG